MNLFIRSSKFPRSTPQAQLSYIFGGCPWGMTDLEHSGHDPSPTPTRAGGRSCRGCGRMEGGHAEQRLSFLRIPHVVHGARGQRNESTLSIISISGLTDWKVQDMRDEGALLSAPSQPTLTDGTMIGLSTLKYLNPPGPSFAIALP